MTPDPVFVSGIWGPYRDIVLPGFWMAEGGQSATGELLNFITETHPAFQQASSLAKESPLADPRMRGSLIGLSSDKSIDALALLYYATLEFIALQTKQIVEAMNSAGHQISTIFMSGSQCQNGILMSLIATACNMPVLIPQYISAAVCHGAAMLGAKAASADESGKTEDLWKIMDRMSRPGSAVYPLQEELEHTLLRVKYDIFLEQLQKQRDYRRNIDAALKGWEQR
ncbi:hypothetical protein KEM54_004234 [Ascosphaera aggregata]|nr:hypothetical protein KEM54_004234 [Ascosphaera aggregata]